MNNPEELKLDIEQMHSSEQTKNEKNEGSESEREQKEKTIELVTDSENGDDEPTSDDDIVDRDTTFC